MAAAQAYRPTVSQYDGNGATRLRNTRTNSQHQQQQQQSTTITTTQGGSCTQQQSQQYASSIGGSSNSGNGSTIAISTITNAPSLSRVRRTSFFHSTFFSRGTKKDMRRFITLTHMKKKTQTREKRTLQICPINNRFNKRIQFSDKAWKRDDLGYSFKLPDIGLTWLQ